MYVSGWLIAAVVVGVTVLVVVARKLCCRHGPCHDHTVTLMLVSGVRVSQS